MSHLAPRDLGFLLLINLIWGFNLIASKVGVQHFPPVFFTALRFSLLAACLVPFLRWHAGRMLPLFVAATLSGGLQFALLFTGVRLTPHVGSIAIATQLGVPFTTLLSVLFLGEVIHWRRRLGIVLAFAGVAVIAVQADVFTYRAGLALVAASAFAGSLGLVAVKRLGETFRPLELQAWFAVAGLPLLWFLTLWLEAGQGAALRTASALDWGALLFTVLASSLVAHTGFYWLISRYPVSAVSPLTTLSPVFSVVLGVLLLDDALSARLLVGGALTLAGVTIIARRDPSAVDTGT
ncbi:MAG TPA: DMT family transporter [Steroidobacteraceae bacterium]|nr:DMT family transporter [Steroidobacteraceae bacterium]